MLTAFSCWATATAEFAKATGLVLDASGAGPGLWCKRWAMIVKNGVVTYFVVEESGIEKTLAPAVAAHLKRN